MYTRMSRREVLRGAAATAAGMALAACAPAAVQQPAVVETAPAAAPQAAAPVAVNLFARSGDITNFMEQLEVAGWLEDHPEIQIKTMGVPDEMEYWTKITTLAAGGEINAVFWNSRSFGMGFDNFAARGLCRDLYPIVEATNFDIESFYPAAVQAVTMDGHLFALPQRWHGGHDAIWYNVDLFEKAGIAEPTDSWTPSDLVSLGKAVTKDVDGDGRIDEWGFTLPLSHPLTLTCLVRMFDGYELSEDGKTCLLNTPDAVQAITWVYDTLFTDKINPPAQMVEKSTGDMFLSGKIAMQQTGWWGRFQAEQVAEMEEADRFKVWAVPLPRSPSGKRPSSVTINCISMSSDLKAETQPAAWELMKGLTSHEVCVDIVHKRFGPGRRSAFEAAKDDINPYMMANYAVLDEVMPARTVWNHRGAEYSNTFISALDPLWIGEATPTQAFIDSVTSQIQKVLDEPRV